MVDISLWALIYLPASFKIDNIKSNAIGEKVKKSNIEIRFVKKWQIININTIKISFFDFVAFHLFEIKNVLMIIVYLFLDSSVLIQWYLGPIQVSFSLPSQWLYLQAI